MKLKSHDKDGCACGGDHYRRQSVRLLYMHTIFFFFFFLEKQKINKQKTIF